MQLAYPSQQCEEGRRQISASRHRTSQYPPFVRPETLRQSCTLRPVHPAPRDDLPLSFLPCQQFPTGPIRFPALWISAAHHRLVLFLFLDPLLAMVPCAGPRQTRTLWATYTIVKNGNGSRSFVPDKGKPPTSAPRDSRSKSPRRGVFERRWAIGGPCPHQTLAS